MWDEVPQAAQEPMTIRDRIEQRFQLWGAFTYRRRRLVISVMVASALGIASELRHLEIDTSMESFLHEDDPTMLVYNQFREQFGREQDIIIAIAPPEVFDLGFLHKLAALHEDLEESVPQIQGVTSLINVRNTRAEGDELIVEDLLAEFPETSEGVEALRELVLSTPLYKDLLISADGQISALLIETDVYTSIAVDEDVLGGFDHENRAAEEVDLAFLTGDENLGIVWAARSVIERHRSPDFRLYMTGAPVMTETLQVNFGREAAIFPGVATLVIGILLFAIFRRVTAVFLPLFVVALSLISTLGVMGLVGVPMTLPMQILPTFLLAVGIGYAVHLMVAFFRHFDSSGSTEESLAHALGHSGLPIVMTALTTIASLVSFAAAELAPVAAFGVFGPIGVAMALIFSLVLLPALIAVSPLRLDTTRSRIAMPGPSDRVLVAAGALAGRHPWKVTVSTVLLVGISFAAASRVRFSQDVLLWLPPTNDLRLSTEFLDSHFAGASELVVAIDTRRENGLHDPEVLRRMDTLNRRMEKYTQDGTTVGKTLSLVDIVKETHQALNENAPGFYAIPEDRRLVAQELLLFENSGSDDLEDFVDAKFRKASFTIRRPWVDPIENSAFVESLESESQRIMGEAAEAQVTGMGALTARTMTAVIHSMTRSYVIAFLLITPLMVLMIGSLRAGLVSMVPNLMPILVTLGLMGALDIPIDTATMMVGSIALGLAVDDTIHFIHTFQRHYRKSGDAVLAIRRTLETTGRALLFTSIVLSLGFFVFMLGELSSVFAFGLLAGTSIGVAFVADIVVTPALLVLVSSWAVESG
jgi:predicted RND superfamily exporter protein